MMKKLLIGFSVTFFLFRIAAAQDYDTRIGLRGGFTNGFTIKNFFAHNTAIEGIVTTR
ncbi:hypothetical protein [Sunxiuqinia indica]|uniref:hypothetical protein n=1 Tax=Sunxiuqinia indica TaxID=2692584 RepID=UPI0019166928|nr:hypothetical protein [Sunxiuqinia indica]